MLTNYILSAVGYQMRVYGSLSAHLQDLGMRKAEANQIIAHLNGLPF